MQRLKPDLVVDSVLHLLNPPAAGRSHYDGKSVKLPVVVDDDAGQPLGLVQRASMNAKALLP